jgi:hypothetical protein
VPVKVLHVFLEVSWTASLFLKDQRDVFSTGELDGQDLVRDDSVPQLDSISLDKVFCFDLLKKVLGYQVSPL